MADGWQKPSACTSSGCVEVTRDSHGFVIVRDRWGYTVSYDEQEWATFVAAVKTGEFG